MHCRGHAEADRARPSTLTGRHSSGTTASSNAKPPASSPRAWVFRALLRAADNGGAALERARAATARPGSGAHRALPRRRPPEPPLTNGLDPLLQLLPHEQQL